jgi:hypothetical protein
MFGSIYVCEQISSPPMINDDDDNENNNNNNNNNNTTTTTNTTTTNNNNNNNNTNNTNNKNNTKSLSCLTDIHLKSNITVIYSNIKLRVKSLSWSKQYQVSCQFIQKVIC